MTIKADNAVCIFSKVIYSSLEVVNAMNATISSCACDYKIPLLYLEFAVFNLILSTPT